MSTKSRMSSESKAVLKWSGVTLEELADLLELGTDEVQCWMDIPEKRGHLISSINSIRQTRVWEATKERLIDIINNLPDEFDNNHRDALARVYCYIRNTLNED